MLPTIEQCLSSTDNAKQSNSWSRVAVDRWPDLSLTDGAVDGANRLIINVNLPQTLDVSLPSLCLLILATR